MMNNLQDRGIGSSNRTVSYIVGAVIWLLVVYLIADALFKDIYGVQYVGNHSVMGVENTTLYSISGIIALFSTAPFVLYFNSRNRVGGYSFSGSGGLSSEQKTKIIVAIIGLITAIVKLITEILPYYLK